MNLLLLPGGSKRNKEWLQKVERNVQPAFERTHRHNYAHWENDESEIDLEHEMKRLAEPVKSFMPYVVFAKSAGTILTCKAAAQGILRPNACMFVGFPLAMITSHHIPADEWLQATDFPITVLQHTADPLGSFRDVKRYFADTGRNGVALHELPGNKHDYDEFQTFKSFTEKLAE